MSSVLKIVSIIVLLNTGVAESAPEIGLFHGPLKECVAEHFLNARNLTPNAKVWTEQRTASQVRLTNIRTLKLAPPSVALVCSYDGRDTGYEGWNTEEWCYLQLDSTVIRRAQHGDVVVAINDSATNAFIRRYLSRCLGSYSKALDLTFGTANTGQHSESRTIEFKCSSSARCSMAVSIPKF